MTDRMYRLLELQQKLDAAIKRTRAKRLVDPVEVARLEKRKRRLRDRLARLFAFPPHLAAGL
ncbi:MULTISPECIES: DUF465 domain-containing protein [unclassified Novosphingobium]|uniref:DUF465 domain-containing protein n=1 Tax=unclassified Novosphingobium TaxID=2644732 RepID=UPI0013575A80|nr:MULTISPECIES: DUF465 domain-containing protein [unclassified Novosphingobium]